MLRIKPLDTLFFRDGRPFTMEEDSWANAVFPPLPSTIYGALRTAYIAYNGGLKEFKKESAMYRVGCTWEDFKVKGVFLEKDQDICFPLPFDLAIDKEEKEDRAYYLSLKSNVPFLSNNMVENFLFSDQIENAQTPSKKYFDDLALASYLNLREPFFKYYQESQFIINEPKTGIKLSRGTRTAKEGYLYRVDLVRLKENCSILVGLEAPDSFPGQGIIKIGGEGRGAVFKKIVKDYMPALDDDTMAKIKKNGRFKIYFATPAIFPEGWLPGKIRGEKFQWSEELLEESCGESDKMSLRLLTAAVGRPVCVGGWDLEARGPKPMRLAIPAGSVYYFEVIEGEAGQVIAALHGKNISLLAEEGFGLTFIGGTQ